MADLRKDISEITINEDMMITTNEKVITSQLYTQFLTSIKKFAIKLTFIIPPNTEIIAYKKSFFKQIDVFVMKIVKKIAINYLFH